MTNTVVDRTFRLLSPLPTHISSKRATLQGGSLEPIRSVQTFSSTDTMSSFFLGKPFFFATPPATFPAPVVFPDILSSRQTNLERCGLGSARDEIRGAPLPFVNDRVAPTQPPNRPATHTTSAGTGTRWKLLEIIELT